MSANETCGGCKTAARYEGSDAKDPFNKLPKSLRDWMRGHCAVCTLEKEWPLVVPLDQNPADIPCDFWEER